MMNKFNIIFLLNFFLYLFSGSAIFGQVSLKVEQIAIALSVEDRQPVGVSDVFADTVGALYCFTEIRGMGESTTVSQVWYYGEKRMAEVKLNVRGYRWRTWSTKIMQVEWTGDWRVDVVSEDGKILKSKRFRIVATNDSIAAPDTVTNQ